MHVLVVEDDQFNLAILNIILSNWGYTVSTAENGAEALDILQKKSFINIVITDWLMPQMDGIELCQHIRAEIHDRYIYIILLSAKDGQVDMMTALKAGADDFLTKSPNHDELQVRMYGAKRVVNLELALLEKNNALQKSITELSQANQNIYNDLMAAAKMQKELLPPQGKMIGNIQAFWHFAPAEYIAGDILNFFSINETMLAFYIIDVSGHGIPAALLSFTLHNMLRTQDHGVGLDQKTLEYPEKVVTALNQYFEKDTPGSKYFTMLYGVINTQTGAGQLCQAGHPSPIKQTISGRVEVLGEGGFPVGLIPGADYYSIDFSLQYGDKLFLYSDGVTDCENPEHIPFGSQKLLKYIEKNYIDKPDDLLDKLYQYLTEWHGESMPNDDITLLILEKEKS